MRQYGWSWSRISTRLVGQCGVATALTISLTSSPAVNEGNRQPLTKFGVIADIQYANIDDAQNFAKTETRFYRASIDGASRAVERWSQEKDLQFIAQLGDMIDGQNSGSYGAGLGVESKSEIALHSVIGTLDKLEPKTVTYFHSIGNHELMNFAQTELQDTISRTSSFPSRHSIQNDQGSSFYEAFRVGTWRFLQLDAYSQSLLHPKHLDGYKEAATLLRANNPNDVVDTPPGTVNFFNGLSGSQCRFVPFNGGIGQAQLDWLLSSLRDARSNKHKVVLFSHLPLHPKSASWRNVPFDAPLILDLLNEFSDVVVAVFAGHSHTGGYYYDTTSTVHHITLQATLTHRTSFGICDVFPDRIELQGFGALPSRTLLAG